MEKIFSNLDCDSTNSDCVQNHISLKKIYEPIPEPATNIVNTLHIPLNTPFQIEMFNMSNLVDKSLAFLVLGRRQSGKTNLIKQVMLEMYFSDIIEECIVFCLDKIDGNGKQTEKYDNVTFCTYSSINDDIIKKILSVQKTSNKKLLLVFDDFENINTNFYNDKLEKLLISREEYNINIIISACTSFCTINNNIFDYVFLGDKMSEKNLSEIHENYFEIVPSFKNFLFLHSELSKNYGFIVSGLCNKKISDYAPKLFSTEIEIPDLKFMDDGIMKPVDLKIGKKQSSMYFKKFDLKNVRENSATCIIGKRDCGKSVVVSTLAENLLKSGKIDKCVIVAPTDKITKFYFQKLGANNVFYEYSSSIIKNIIEKQEKQKSKVLLILDDCIAQKSALKDESFLNLVMNGRHLGITLIFTMQFPMGITPEIRCNFDYVFLAADDMISNQKRMYDHYAGMFPAFDSFRQIFYQLTSNYGMMVINNSTKKQNLTDKVQWFLADNNIKCKVPEFIFDEPDSPSKVSKKTLEILESSNVDYSLLEEIVQCNMKIYDLVKYSLDDKKKTSLAKLILKSNNLIIESCK